MLWTLINIDPWGEILADGGVGSGIISAKINLASVKETREKFLA